jgi:hypothetical protein
MSDDVKDLPLHAEAEARSKWRGTSEDGPQSDAVQTGEETPQPTVGLEVRPPD